MLIYQILASTIYMEKKFKKSNRISRFKISALTWNDKPDFLMDHILHQLFKIVSGISLKSMKHWLIIFQQKYIYAKQKK